MEERLQQQIGCEKRIQLYSGAHIHRVGNVTLVDSKTRKENATEKKKNCRTKGIAETMKCYEEKY